MGIKIGSNNIGDVYVGNSKISEIYVGNNLVYSAGSPAVYRDFILNVKRQTRNTYVNSTSYSNDSFVGITVNVSSGGTATATYGDVTKTLSAGSNTVIFGKYMGTDDGTPEQGLLTISGDYYNIRTLTTNTAKSTSSNVVCITGVSQWFGDQVTDTTNMFNGQTLLAITDPIVLPERLTTLGANMFYQTNINTSITALGVTRIESNALRTSMYITSVDFSHNGLLSITGTQTGPFNGDVYLNKNFSGDFPADRTSGDVYFLGTFDDWVKIQHFTTQSPVVDDLYLNGQKLTSVTALPAGITQIYPATFQNFSVFSSSAITIPTGISIGQNAFRGSNIVINGSLSLGNVDLYAFWGCSSANITGLTITGNVGTRAFYNCLMSGTVNVSGAVASWAFQGTNITTATCGSVTGTSGSPSFYSCASLTTLTINGGTINKGVTDCASLTTLNIGANVTSVYDKCIENLSALTTINFNATACDGVAGSGQIYQNCCFPVGTSNNQVTINIGSSVTKIPEYFVANDQYVQVIMTNASALTTVGNYAFYSTANALTFNQALPNTITTIGNYAFYGTYFITNQVGTPYYLPTSLQTVGESAFQYCSTDAFSTGITYRYLIIPATCTSVGMMAFRQQNHLFRFVFLSTDVTNITLSSSAFINSTTNATLPQYYFRATESNVTSWTYWTTSYFENTIYNAYTS